MIEILQILLFYLIFSFTIMTPLNIFNYGQNKFDSIDISSFNLVINLTILLILSLLSYSLNEIQKVLIIYYPSILVLLYFKDLTKFFKLQLNFIPILIMFFIISISVANNLKLGWDAKFFYYIKSLYFFEGKSLTDLKEFNAYHFHPHLGSYFWAFFRNMSFIDYEYFGRLFYVFIFVFSIFYIIPQKKNNLLVVLYLSLILSIFFQYKFFSGLQEILIFSYLMIISKYLKFFENRKNNFLILIFTALYLNLIFWTKTEGLVYISIFLLIINFCLNLKFNEKIIYSSMIFFIFFFKIFIYNYYSLNLDAQPSYNFEYLKNLNIKEIIFKIRIIFIWLVYYSLNNIFFITGIFYCIYLSFTKNFNNQEIKVYNIYLILIISFIFSAYIFRDQEIVNSIRTTMDRLVMTSSGFFVYMIMKNIDKIIKKKLTNN